MNNFAIGDAIVWKYSPPRGYGYIFRIPGKIIGFNEKSVRPVKIEVEKVTGEFVARWVKVENLEHVVKQVI